MDGKTMSLYFSLFNEIGIIDQLSRASLDAALPDGLISPHFGVLNHLIRVQDGSTPLALANAFQVAKTTMTHTISGLVKHGLVTVLPHPDDGRSKQVWIGDKGRDLCQKVVMAAAPTLAKTLSGFSETKINSLVEDLATIRKIMDAARD